VLGKSEQHKWRFRIAAPARGFPEKSKSRIWQEPSEHTVRFAPLDFAQANQVMKEGVMTYETLQLAGPDCEHLAGDIKRSLSLPIFSCYESEPL